MSRGGHARAIDAATEPAHSCAPKRPRHFRPSHHTAADATQKLKRRSAHEVGVRLRGRRPCIFVGERRSPGL
jgi:hypothetical protein